MYAICQDMPGVSAEDYEKLLVELDGAQDDVAGLIAHVAGATDSGFRIIDVWASKADAQRFFAEHLTPALDRAHGVDREKVAQHFRIFEIEA